MYTLDTVYINLAILQNFILDRCYGYFIKWQTHNAQTKSFLYNNTFAPDVLHSALWQCSVFLLYFCTLIQVATATTRLQLMKIIQDALAMEFV